MSPADAQELQPQPDYTVQPQYQAGETLLGRYVLMERLAAGGMGAVWRAKNKLLDSDVAVKIMFRVATGPAGVAQQRAHTEARLAAQLQHPAVCTALDFGISDRGDPVVVTELLRGQGLHDVLREGGRLTATRTAQLLLPILDGLGAAHAKGIVHRDLKPANMFLARVEDGSEQPKLLDFGIARGLADKQRITVQGLVCGTPDYMSPEQARGSSDVDLRSDLWSFCVTMYEMVTDRVPFRGENYNAVLFSIAHDDPDPISELPEADSELSKIIARGLNKDRELRFQSAREIAKQLSMFLLARGVEVDACGHSLRSRLSSPEIPLTEHELALVNSPSLRGAQLAPTMRRSARPALRSTGARYLSGVLTAHKPMRRWAVLGLALTSLCGLGAWSSRSKSDPSHMSAGTESVGVAGTGQPLTLPTTVIEAAPPRNRAATAEASQAVRSEPPPRRSASATTPAGMASGKQKLASRAGVSRSNALGYDFGL